MSDRRKRTDKTPGRGVVRTDLGAMTQEAADALFAKCDAVVVVAVRSSGSGDTNELVSMSRRGSALHLSAAIERAYEIDTSRVQVEIDDDEEDDEDEDEGV